MDELRHSKLRVLLVDSHVTVREAVGRILHEQPEFEIVGQAGTAQEALSLARLHCPDVILMDSRLPDATSRQVTSVILAERPDCRIIFMAAHDEDETLFTAIRSGVSGYVLKNMPAANLVAAMRAVLNGEVVLAAPRSGYSDATPAVRRECVLDKLSRRELEVLKELSLGASNEQIARRLYVSETSVKNQVLGILEKLELPNRREAAKMARQQGLRAG